MILTRETPGVVEREMDSTGKVLVLDPEVLKPEYREAKWQLFLCKGGFGARLDTMGSAVFGTYLEDQETCRHEKYDFIGMATPALIAEVLHREDSLDSAGL